MLDTTAMREKYKPRGQRHIPPPGTHDVLRLCCAVDDLVQLVEDIKGHLSTDRQNDVSTRLSWIRR